MQTRTSEEKRPKEGRLKIFLGYCAGVGKTYAMLQRAARLQQEGVDVVVGWVDTHGRLETEAMLAGLEVIPRKPLKYRDVEMGELDIDRLLARRPQLVLVDELAHSNVPGSRHRKRWQDVEEILKAGIDVYTTLNIQHIESLNDVVSQITRVRVRETIPDRILDEAEEIKLIDVPPEELLQRLKEGKVYIPAQARRAAENFFGHGKLAALRELVMRRAAERVEAEMGARAQSVSSVAWPSPERLLVCLGPSPFSERLIRATKRLATQLRSEWEALYVDTEESLELSDDERERLEHNLSLAESLGAHCVRISGEHVGTTTLEYARSQGITKIICGRSHRRSSPWLRPLSDSILESSGPIDVLVVTSDRGEKTWPPVERASGSDTSWTGYALAAGLVAVTTAFGEFAYNWLSTTNLAMFYLLAVVLTALRAGRGPATACATLGVLALDFFFVPPRYTFAVSDSQYFVTFAALLAVGLVVGRQTSRVRDQARASKKGQEQVSAAFALSRDLALAASAETIVSDLVEHLKGPFGVPTTVFLPRGEQVEIHPGSDHKLATMEDLAVAGWVMRNGQMAGCGTDTLPAVKDLYFPLRRGGKTLGVLRLKLDGKRLPSNQRQLLETLSNLTAMAFERVGLTEDARRAQILEESERLQSSLLNSISHDLQTPITSIMGSLDSLADPAVANDEAALKGLALSAREQAERLRKLVANLLDMTRVESRQVGLRKELCALDDLIGSALSGLEDAYRDRKVELDIPPDLPLLPVDFVPFSQALHNLFENAARYSPPGTPVKIRAWTLPDSIRIAICDQGPGVPLDERERVFEKFYRLGGPVNGTGLGLAIARGLVELHGGWIWIEDEGFILEVPL